MRLSQSWAYLALCGTVGSVLVAGIGPGELCGDEISTDAAGQLTTAERSYDHFIGWYKLSKPEYVPGRVIPGSNALIPIFKRDNTYWTVCRGFEIPLKSSAGSLEWAFIPSTMDGTKIGYDEAAQTYFITIEDSYFKEEIVGGSGTYASGERQRLTKTDPPSWLRDAKAEPPRSNDDFVGWHLPQWFPFFVYEVRKEGEKYVAIGHMVLDDEQSPGSKEVERHELTPLAGQLGFVLDESPNEQVNLLYNQALERYEMTKEDTAEARERHQPAILRHPMVRLPRPPEGISVSTAEEKYIGIPSTRG